MSIYVQTGNAIDIEITYVGTKTKIIGLAPRIKSKKKTGKTYPLPDPAGFVEVLERLIKEGQ